MRQKLLKKFHSFKHNILRLPPLDVRPTDCFLVSWPRSGNTWMRYMLFNAIYPNAQWDLLSIDLKMPILDRIDLPQILPSLDDQPFRLFKSHDPFNAYFLKGKVVYILRDGRDALLSHYHYRRQMDKLQITFPEFVARAVKGKVTYGSWHKHVIGWLAHQNNPNVLFLRYEEMLLAPMQALELTLDHFGIHVPLPQIQAAVQKSTVEQVNKGFEKYAASRSKQCTGGLGGGSGKWKAAYRPVDLDLFMRHAGDAMNLCAYPT